jgi:hypothetical protein
MAIFMRLNRRLLLVGGWEIWTSSKSGEVAITPSRTDIISKPMDIIPIPTIELNVSDRRNHFAVLPIAGSWHIRQFAETFLSSLSKTVIELIERS